MISLGLGQHRFLREHFFCEGLGSRAHPGDSGVVIHLCPSRPRGLFQCRSSQYSCSMSAGAPHPRGAASISRGPRVRWAAEEHVCFGIDEVGCEEREDENGDAHHQRDDLGGGEKGQTRIST